MESEMRTEHTYGKVLHKFLETGKVSDDDKEDVLREGGLIDFMGLEHHQELFAGVVCNLRLTDKDTPEYEIGKKGKEVYLEHPKTKEKMPIPFYGIVDRLTTDGFIDYKTGRSAWGPKKIKDCKQFTFYWMWYVQEFGREPNAHIVNFIKPKDDKEATVVIKDIKRTKQECIDLWEEAMELYTRLIVRGDCNPECQKHFFCPSFLSS